MADQRQNRNFLESEGLRTITILFNDAVRAEDFIVCGTRGWFVDSAYSPEDDKIVEREAGRYRLSFQAAEKLQKQYGGEILAFRTTARYGGVTCEKLAAAVAKAASAALLPGICTAFRARGCILPARACGPSWSRPTSFSSRRCAFFREKALDKPERLCYTIPNR